CVVHRQPDAAVSDQYELRCADGERSVAARQSVFPPPLAGGGLGWGRHKSWCSLREEISPTRRFAATSPASGEVEKKLLPHRLVGVPALPLQFLSQRLDHAGVVLLGAFLIARGIVGEDEFAAGALVGR